MTTALKNALAASSVKPIFLAKFEFPSADVMFWSGNGDLEWPASSGDIYTGLGDLSAIDFPAETDGGSTAGAVFSISGIPSSTTSLALTENYKNSFCSVWFGALDSSDLVIADPYLKYKGFIDVMEMTDDGATAGASVRVEGFAYAVGASNRKYTDEDQRREYTGDRGMEYVAGLQDKEVIWGIQGPKDTVPDPIDDGSDDWEADDNW